MDFSFRYNGQICRSSALKISKKEEGKIVYTLDCLRIEQQIRDFGNGAKYSLLYFENTGKEKSGILSDISDIDDEFDLQMEEDMPIGYADVEPAGRSKVLYTMGPNGPMEFKQLSERFWVRVGNRYSCKGGRSSQGIMPFFEVQNGREQGLLFAVGWTGQWYVHFMKNGGKVQIRAGIEDLNFYLEPGERIRTASVLLVPYSEGTVKAHNAFRRLMRKEFSVFPDEKCGEPPLSLQTWGGARSEFLKKQIRKAAEEKLGFEYFWVDAGWYGDYEEECPDEHTGCWGAYTGDWQVNTRVHPDKMKDVFALAEKNGMKGLLWFEPERIRKGTTEFYRTHRDMLLECEEDPYNALLDLSREDAKEFMLETVSSYIQELNLSCYRQDFNFDPLPFWRHADTEDRKGITQIKHIMALYEIWDTLRARFPHLVIDNCASGGNRLDIETLSRSIPLWRSDVNCVFDFPPYCAQNQNMGISNWIPYHGNGISRFADDRYRFRSCHSPATAANFLGYEAFGNEPYDFEEVRFLVEEFKAVRRFYSCDFYPVFGNPGDEYSWAGWQYHDSETEEGVLVAFRRAHALPDSVTVQLGGLNKKKVYVFENSDTGEKAEYSGTELSEKGLTICLKEKRSSVLFKYYEKK